MSGQNGSAPQQSEQRTPARPKTATVSADSNSRSKQQRQEQPPLETPSGGSTCSDAASSWSRVPPVFQKALAVASRCCLLLLSFLDPVRVRSVDAHGADPFCPLNPRSSAWLFFHRNKPEQLVAKMVSGRYEQDADGASGQSALDPVRPLRRAQPQQFTLADCSRRSSRANLLRATTDVVRPHGYWLRRSPIQPSPLSLITVRGNAARAELGPGTHA